MNTQSLRYVKSITCDIPSFENSNAITITLEQREAGLMNNSTSITLFGLPADVAAHVSNALRTTPTKSESEIRDDERRKVRAEIAQTIAADPDADFPF